MSVPRLSLRPKRDRRVRSGHPWIFSNELEPGFVDLEPGAVVDVFDAKGAFVGRGLVSPQSLIAVRLYSRLRKEDLDSPAFYAMRIRESLNYRQAIFPDRRSYRLIHAEGDFLPGLVIDKFEDYLAVQITTVGMDKRTEILKEALRSVLNPVGAVFRNESKVRELEGLTCGQSEWFGEIPDTVEIDEYGVSYKIPLLGGQKTGHFFDQAINRKVAGEWCRDRTVLDVYANTGGWALQALKNGAKHATIIDKSAATAELSVDNVERNGFGERCDVVCAEATRTLEMLVAEGSRYGAVVLDPPAFAKNRKSASAALKGYTRINAMGMTLVEPGGFLFTSSCSYHVQEDRFLDAISSAAKLADRRLRLVRRGEQAPDHPMLPAVPESRYLKSLAFQVLI